MSHGLAVPASGLLRLGHRLVKNEGLLDRDGAGIRVQEDRRQQTQHGLVVANVEDCLPSGDEACELRILFYLFSTHVIGHHTCARHEHCANTLVSISGIYANRTKQPYHPIPALDEYT